MDPCLQNQVRRDFKRAAAIGRQRATDNTSRSEGSSHPLPTREISAEVVDHLLDPALWQPALKQYALATNLAVELFDAEGRPTGECVNPQPLWSLLAARRPDGGGCAFSVLSKSCTCLTDALQQRNTVFARDRIGLVHFAVPLVLENNALGWVLAGQVFDHYPDTLPLDRAAREAGLPAQRVWNMARRARPIGTATLRVYADLLTTLANALLQAHYSGVLEMQRQEQLRQTQKLESIGLLAGGIAHDFNNLLTGVLGNASLILTELPAGHPARARAEQICDTVERAERLIRQLLAYSGKGRLLIKLLDLSKVVRDLQELIRLSISDTVSLRLELAESLPTIEADASQMQQVIMNLVINGAEAIGRGGRGTVVVRTGLQDFDSQYIQRIRAPGIEPGRFVFLEVQDTGCGMDESTLARIFDPFFTTKFTGRGLGLAAVSGIVRGHKGAIEVHSAPEQGSTFKVLFPATDKAGVDVQPRPEAATE